MIFRWGFFFFGSNIVFIDLLIVIIIKNTTCKNLYEPFLNPTNHSSDLNAFIKVDNRLLFPPYSVSKWCYCWSSCHKDKRVISFFFPAARHKTWVCYFTESILETWKQIEMVPGCHPGWNRQSDFIFLGGFVPKQHNESEVSKEWL